MLQTTFINNCYLGRQTSTATDTPANYLTKQWEFHVMDLGQTWLSLQGTSGYSSRNTWQNARVLAAPTVRNPVPGINSFSPAPPAAQHTSLPNNTQVILSKCKEKNHVIASGEEGCSSKQGVAHLLLKLGKRSNHFHIMLRRTYTTVLAAGPALAFWEP
jgi:hypothetical protein